MKRRAEIGGIRHEETSFGSYIYIYIYIYIKKTRIKESNNKLQHSVE